MNGIDILLSPPVAFVLILAVVVLIYLLGKRMAPKLTRTGGKLTSYACGEDIPGTKVQFGYRLFFFVALFFTIMHVASVATVPGGVIAFRAVAYLVVIAAAISILYSDVD